MTTLMRSTGTSSSSLTIWAKIVRAPWPMSDVPEYRTALPSSSSRTRAFDRPVVGPDLRPTAMPRPRPGADRLAPADHLGGAPQGLCPVTVRGRVTGDERVAARGQVAEPQLHRVDGQDPGGLVEVRLDGPDLLRIAEAPERGGRHGVGQDASRPDADVRDGVRPVRGEAPLPHGPIGDVRVGADEVVGVDVAKDDRAVAPEAGPDVDPRRPATDGLEALLEGEDEATRPAGLAGQEGDDRLVLRMLLAAECPARVGGQDADRVERQVQDAGHHPLQPVRVLDRAPDDDAVALRAQR